MSFNIQRKIRKLIVTASWLSTTLRTLRLQERLKVCHIVSRRAGSRVRWSSRGCLRKLLRQGTWVWFRMRHLRCRRRLHLIWSWQLMSLCIWTIKRGLSSWSTNRYRNGRKVVTVTRGSSKISLWMDQKNHVRIQGTGTILMLTNNRTNSNQTKTFNSRYKTCLSIPLRTLQTPT